MHCFKKQSYTYRRSFLALLFQRVVSQPLDLECLSGPEEALEPVLVDLHLAVVHKVEKAAQVVLPDIPQDDDGVLARVALKEKRTFRLWQIPFKVSSITRVWIWHQCQVGYFSLRWWGQQLKLRRLLA